jgi:hypothetical protein
MRHRMLPFVSHYALAWHLLDFRRISRTGNNLGCYILHFVLREPEGSGLASLGNRVLGRHALIRAVSRSGAGGAQEWFRP